MAGKRKISAIAPETAHKRLRGENDSEAHPVSPAQDPTGQPTSSLRTSRDQSSEDSDDHPPSAQRTQITASAEDIAMIEATKPHEIRLYRKCLFKFGIVPGLLLPHGLQFDMVNLTNNRQQLVYDGDVATVVGITRSWGQNPCNALFNLISLPCFTEPEMISYAIAEAVRARGVDIPAPDVSVLCNDDGSFKNEELEFMFTKETDEETNNTTFYPRIRTYIRENAHGPTITARAVVARDLKRLEDLWDDYAGKLKTHASNYGKEFRHYLTPHSDNEVMKMKHDWLVSLLPPSFKYVDISPWNEEAPGTVPTSQKKPKGSGSAPVVDSEESEDQVVQVPKARKVVRNARKKSVVEVVLPKKPKVALSAPIVIEESDESEEELVVARKVGDSVRAKRIVDPGLARTQLAKQGPSKPKTALALDPETMVPYSRSYLPKSSGRRNSNAPRKRAISTQSLLGKKTQRQISPDGPNDDMVLDMDEDAPGFPQEPVINEPRKTGSNTSPSQEVECSPQAPKPTTVKVNFDDRRHSFSVSRLPPQKFALPTKTAHPKALGLSNHDMSELIFSKARDPAGRQGMSFNFTSSEPINLRPNQFRLDTEEVTIAHFKQQLGHELANWSSNSTEVGSSEEGSEEEVEDSLSHVSGSKPAFEINRKLRDAVEKYSNRTRVESFPKSPDKTPVQALLEKVRREQADGSAQSSSAQASLLKNDLLSKSKNVLSSQISDSMGAYMSSKIPLLPRNAGPRPSVSYRPSTNPFNISGSSRPETHSSAARQLHSLQGQAAPAKAKQGQPALRLLQEPARRRSGDRAESVNKLVQQHPRTAQTARRTPGGKHSFEADVIDELAQSQLGVLSPMHVRRSPSNGSAQSSQAPQTLKRRAPTDTETDGAKRPRFSLHPNQSRSASTSRSAARPDLPRQSVEVEGYDMEMDDLALVPSPRDVRVALNGSPLVRAPRDVLDVSGVVASQPMAAPVNTVRKLFETRGSLFHSQETRPESPVNAGFVLAEADLSKIDNSTQTLALSGSHDPQPRQVPAPRQTSGPRMISGAGKFKLHKIVLTDSGMESECLHDVGLDPSKHTLLVADNDGGSYFQKTWEDNDLVSIETGKDANENDLVRWRAGLPRLTDADFY